MREVNLWKFHVPENLTAGGIRGPQGSEEARTMQVSVIVVSVQNLTTKPAATSKTSITPKIS